jgi:hypothetical protein
MIATLLAVHLALLAQTGAPEEEPTRDPTDDATEEAPAAETPPAEREARVRTPVPPPARRQLSLLSAESLHGGSMATAWAGWPSLGAMWAQGISDTDDLGLALEFDWSGTELRASAFYRRPLGTAGPWDMGGRLALGWYGDFGGKFVHDGNHDDRGIELVPSLVFSVRGGGGVFSAWGDLPITVTLYGDGGILFAPRLSLAYEVPLYPDLNLGVIGGVGYRAGAGDAPMRDGRVDVRFLVTAAYEIL